MNQDTTFSQPSVLKIAWLRYAELDANANEAVRYHLGLRGWVLILAVVATLLAILTDVYQGQGRSGILINQVLRIVLILVPIVSSVVLAFANKFQQGERWLALRTGAEEIKKEIYLYRTLLQEQEERGLWLADRTADIQRQVFEAAGEELVLTPYTGKIPPYYDPADEYSDPGFADLLAAEYLRYRLQEQLRWHTNKVTGLQTTRTRLQIAIFAFGGLGTFLAALANIQGLNSLSVWVALTTSVAAALTAWMELRRLDSTISNYSQLILELKLIQDHWHSLSPSEQTGDEFFKLVIATEKVLWSQHNQYVSEMRQAVAELRGEDSDTLDRVTKMPAPPAIDNALLEQAQKTAAAETSSAEAEEEQEKPEITPVAEKDEAKKGRPHAFVVMPFGRKQGPDGRWIDFNTIYQQLIQPALEEAGFEPFRADEEAVSGDILTDMFQELLLADLVIADLSIDNANVFYELGVRHAMRKRGIVHIQSGRAYMPFDIFNVRTIPYQCDKHGKPDPKHQEKDKQAIIQVIRETWASAQDRVHSPIFNLLDGLNEPDRKALQTPLATGYWREYREWQERVAIARRQQYIGDILLLTEEIRNPLIREEAIAEAGRALASIGNHALALKEYQRGLEINPRNMVFRREEAFHLGRLGRMEEASVKLERLVQDNPADSEAVAFLGRLYKDRWRDQWNQIEDSQTRLKTAYDSSYLLKRSIDTYLMAYSSDQSHYYSGINALTLSSLLDYLVRQVGQNGQTDPELEAVRQQIPSLAGAVQFSLEQMAAKKSDNYWVFASLGDLAVCRADDPTVVTRTYKRALAQSTYSKFSLKSTLAQLRLLNSLGFRLQYVIAGISVLQEAFDKMETAEKTEPVSTLEKPSQVFLFAGHMIDHPDRPKPRFPAGMEDEARDRIEEALNKLKASADDLAITAGVACGGDILFIESCLKRQMKVEVYLPFPEAEFIEQSVRFAGDDWVERFYHIRQHPNVIFHLQPERVGPVPQGDSPFARNNRWTLYSALGYGIDRIRLIVLWNGQGGDGPGGTAHMVQEVRRLGGIVEHLDTTEFDYWRQQTEKLP